ncbi:MAG: ferritin [Myxococcales bacterium]|nr:ferritin [Myxococcales bacterium]MCB9737420.1 ferritin [Deltaproteobacteria bacterium]
MASDSYHEPFELLPDEVRDRHRAISSLMEELEAVDWYDQRIAVTKDAALREILAHNRDEEKEHAAMVMEWLRRNDATFAGHMDDYLYKEGPIRESGGGEGGGAAAAAGDGSLGIGSLRKSGGIEE